MDLYAEYIAERESRALYLDPEGRGFLTYSFHDDGNTLYIADIYVKPEFRREGLAAKMADKITDFAKSKGAQVVLGSIARHLPSAEASRKILLSWGMVYCDLSQKEVGRNSPSLDFYIKEIV